MKKLMIASAIVCATAMSQAADYKWNIKTSGDSFYNFDGTKFSGTAYVYSGLDGESIYNAWMANSAVDFTSLTDYAGSLTFADGETSSSFNFGETKGEYDFIMALVDNGGNLYVDLGWEANPTSELAGGTDINANLGWTASEEDRIAYSAPATGGWVENGTYYTQAVPEPTSGLLLLLGVAGLALRRRRA